MKNINLYKVLFALAVVLFSSCEGDPDLRMPGIEDGFLPRIVIDEVNGSSLVDFSNIDGVVFAMNLSVEEDYTKTKASNYDLVVRYAKLDKTFKTAVVGSDISLGAVSYTIDQVVGALGVDKNDIAIGESLTFALDVTLESGTKLPAFVDGDLTYSSGIFSIPGVSPIANYSVACGIFTDFAGSYKIEHVSGPTTTVFGMTLFTDGEVVELVNTGYTSREFGFSYLGGGFGLRNVKLELSCGDVLVQYSKTGIGCGGPGLNFGPSATIHQYDPNDDSELMISFLENFDGGCGGGPQEVVWKLVKQ